MRSLAVVLSVIFVVVMSQVAAELRNQYINCSDAEDRKTYFSLTSRAGLTNPLQFRSVPGEGEVERDACFQATGDPAHRVIRPKGVDSIPTGSFRLACRQVSTIGRALFSRPALCLALRQR